MDYLRIVLEDERIPGNVIDRGEQLHVLAQCLDVLDGGYILGIAEGELLDGLDLVPDALVRAAFLQHSDILEDGLDDLVQFGHPSLRQTDADAEESIRGIVLETTLIIPTCQIQGPNSVSKFEGTVLH